jgi:hypothetical protein
VNTVDLIASLIKSGRHEEAIQAVNELVETASSLEREREEMQARIAELEIYEEREMIGDPAGLGGPSISSSLRERDAAQADAENTRHQLDWANERIRDLENNIRSHKRACPMFR